VEIIRNNTAGDFLQRAGAWLEQSEAENNLILGIAEFFRAHSGAVRIQPYFFTVEDQDTVAGVALWTPPRRLLISDMPDAAVTALAVYLAAEEGRLPGVLGPKPAVKLLADAWIAKTGKASRLKMSQRIYACEQLIVPIFRSGRLRLAATEDQPLVMEWCLAFCRDAGIGDETPYYQAQVPRKLKEGLVYVWDDSKIVSMAAVERETSHGIAISWVYTPPHLRKQGYATSCVAALTRRMLDSGKRFCCLYTDLANAISNSIYQKIGYRPICDVQDWVFD
jgi:predicted GNAT family acetyltransferase